MDRPLGVAGRAVVERDGEILLLQRSKSSRHEPGLWELPGGKLEYGEVLTEALRREIHEESGIEISVGRPVLTWQLLRDPFWVTGITFACRYLAGEVVLSPEHSACVWVAPDALDSSALAETIADQIAAWTDARRADGP